MAMEEIKLTQTVPSEALSADIPDKKKGGKFQPFKKLFGKRKKKDTSFYHREASAAKSHSPQCVNNGTFSSDEETLEENLRSFNCSMGTRAFSHDSIFIPDGGAESEQTVQAMSQDNILGKVKTLQRQLGKNIKFGQPPPNTIPMKKADSGEASLEEDLFPTSPMEIVTQQDIVPSDATQNKSSETPSSPSPLNLPGARSEMEEKVAPVKPSRPKRHLSSAGTIESVNLDAIPLAIARLDNSAAKHKLAVKPKNQRVSKRHRRLVGDQPDDRGASVHQLSLDQNGHSVDDKPVWHQQEPEPLDSEEEKRRQEEYWRELEAKCKRQKAEAAERKRLEEQRMQALERRLWEENRRQELLEEEGEEEEKLLQPEAEKRHLKEEQQRAGRQGAGDQEQREPEETKEWEHLEEEAEPPEPARQLEEFETRSRHEVERRQQEQEEREPKECQRSEELEEQKRREAEKLEEEKRLEEPRRQKELEDQRQREEEEERKMMELRRQEEEEEEKMMELRRQEEERKMMELRRQEEERKMMELRRQEEERKMMELRRQEEERKMMELRRQEEERKMMELRRQEEERKMMELRRQEEERKMMELRRQEEERKMMELRKQEEERKMMELRKQEEERKMMELRKQEEERKMMELRRLEEEERKMMELRRLEEEAKRKEKLGKQEEVEPHRRQEAKKELGGSVLRGKEGREGEWDRRGSRSPLQSESAEESEEEHLKPKKLKEDSKEPGVWEKQNPEAELLGELRGPRGDFHRARDAKQQGKKEETHVHPPHKQEARAGDTLAPVEKKEGATPEKDRKVEELRWQEVEERQTMPRPYTFQVSSGGKQFLFPKVNLSPVTPLKDTGVASASHELKTPKTSPAPHALPSSLSVPHTAILVTGAQLCGPAVNLSQIKDTACKSLLGLSEEKKHMDVPTLENTPRAPGDPRMGLGKARPLQESPSSAAALAEWASIRSRILKGAESERDPSRPSDEPHPRPRSDSRGSNIRKTPPVNAKFSIMPAWQKFSDGSSDTIVKQNAEAESLRKRAGLGPADDELTSHPPATDAREAHKGPDKEGVHPEPTDTTEGCKFAKDLPSFLVPSFPSPSHKVHVEPGASSDDSEATGGPRKAEPVMPGTEEKASPFGIKLRRTNYSLRFHCDQQTEQKKKKRFSSTGDSSETGQQASGSTSGEKETEGGTLQSDPQLPLEKKQAPASRKDSADAPIAAQSRSPLASSQTPTPEHDKATHKMPPVQKPALAPKPTSQTPPSSPLSKLSRPYLVELLARRAGKSDPEPCEPCKEGPGSGDLQQPQTPPPEERKTQKREEEEVAEAERKPTSPALSAGRQEKPSQIPEEASRKEKPVLQSRHSVDGSKLSEKAEPAQPLWITLALQKQKGFREQQATREERKQAREAKQAEKFSKENVGASPQPSGGSGISRAASLHKPAAQPEEKKPETTVSRLERREQLKKANTLPTSVTVEISDSAPPTPLVKEVAKRLSTPDAAPVSTEPAWLALAKRKAKAWSDCPQIIK